MLNKFVNFLLDATNEKVFTLSRHPDDEGYLCLGNLVRPSGISGYFAEQLRYIAFSAVLDELELPNYDTDELIRYFGATSELNKNVDFSIKFDRLNSHIDMIKEGRWFFYLCSFSGLLSFASLGLIYFSWWFVILSIFIYRYGVLAGRKLVLRNAATMSILYELDGTFAKYCRKKDLAMDFPDDLSTFPIITDQLRQLTSLKTNFGNDERDRDFTKGVILNLEKQKQALGLVCEKIHADWRLQSIQATHNRWRQKN